jgi:ATP-binding cassette subfamily F protein 3
VEELVRLESVVLARDGRVLLASVDWRVRRGDRWALWGPNGAGKSTLLELLAGGRSAAGGHVQRLPGSRIVRVAQEPRLPSLATLGELASHAPGAARAAERELREEERRLAEGAGDLARYAELQERFERAGGYRAEARVRAELADLLPDRDEATRLATLSRGERRRAALAVALAQRPDLLLLDEPTNHLDAPGRGWLARRLAHLPSDVALVVASHDRELLGRVSTASARVADGRVEPVRLPFDEDRERRGVLHRSAEARRRRQAREAERLSQAAAAARRQGSPRRAAAARSIERRARQAEGSAAGAAALVERVRERDARAAPPRAATSRPDEAAGPLLRARGLTRRERFADVHLDLDGGEKVVLLGHDDGASGALLAMLAARSRSDGPAAEVWLRPGARVFFADAERRGLSDEPVRDQLRRWVRDARADQLLALVDLPHERWTAPPEALSGGERGRAALALLLASEPDLALLDRPEADLDLPSLERLEQALVDPRTAVVLATDDLRLAQAVTTDVRSLDGGTLVAFRGGVAGWRAGRRRREEELPEHLPVAPRPSEPGAIDPTELEDEQAAIEARLEDPASLGERERLRLEHRRAELIAARMAAYDRDLPAPAPRFSALEPPLRVGGDLIDGRLVLAPEADWPSRPSVRRVGPVVHLALPDPPGAAWTPWARAAALRACLGVIVPVLAPGAVQTRAGPGPAPAPFEALDAAWWVATRESWERWAGWT